MIRVGLVDGADSRELRRSVLRPHLRLTDVLPGDDRPDATHIAAVDEDGTVLSACVLHSAPCPWRDDAAGAWRLMQMATTAAARGQGLGGRVVDVAVDHLSRHGVPLVWCYARQRAVPFYARHGFETYGDVFVEYPEPGKPVPHLRMARELSAAATASG